MSKLRQKHTDVEVYRSQVDDVVGKLNHEIGQINTRCNLQVKSN
jgi:hypothetical protein